MYFLIIYFINAIYLLSAMVVAKGKFGGISTVNKQTITIFNLDNPVYQKLNAEVSETFKLEDIITKVEDIYEDETSTFGNSESDIKSYSSSKFNDDSPDNEILIEGRKSSWNGNYRISDEVDTEKPIFNNKKKMNKFKPFSLGPQLHNETVQIAKRQVDDDDHDDVSSLEKIEDADDSGEIEFVEPKEALLDSLGVPENKSPDQEVSIPEELSNNEDINFVEKSADVERNIADIQEQIPQENNELKSKEFNPDTVKDAELFKEDSNEFKILYGNAVIEPNQPTFGFIPNAIESDTAESIITSKEDKTETLIVTAATTIKETVNIINDAEDVGNIMNLKIAETSTRRNNWRKFNDSSWKPNRYLKKALLHKLNRNKTSTYKDVNVKPSASPAHPKKALFYAKVNKYTPSDDDDDDDDDDVKIRITKQDKHRHLDELYVEEDATTKNEMLNISGVPNIVQDSTKKDSYIMKLISNVDRQRAVTRTTEAATVEDISEHHSALDKLIHLERKYEEAITSTTVKPQVTKSSERKSKYSKKGIIYKHYEYTTPETNDNTDLDTEVEVKPLQHPRPKDSKAGFFKSFPMKYTVSDDDEPTINQMKKTEDASDYFDYQQTVIISNRTITYDQDYSNGETTTRYIIPNRTKSADHDFSNEESTTRYTRTVSKIIQYFDYQQTAIIPNRTVTADYINDETTRYLIPKRTKSSEHNFNYGETTTQYSRTVSKTIQNLDLDETTLQPVVKPTRVRLKPSRPIHKYDTTTQMKWRSDFTKKKQDVLENSTTSKGYIEIISLKNHDFLQSKLNLSSYKREDQMKEEMFSTDSVDRAKQFSMPDNFANWKPESDIANAAAVPKNKYFDYQQTVIIPNRTITYDQDFSNDETTTRYIIPNRTKSDDHDFEHDETTTQFSRTFSKIIQKINHNETTIQPIVKPTRVRHKPSRPIHEYDTTTQMKWRRDFITQKQDVLENSTTPKPNIEIIKLKKHDFLHSKLNLSPYEREDQMNEEMLSTDRVVGRKRMETVSVDAKQFSMPDNFANWKPEPKIANAVPKNKYFDYQQTVINPNRTITYDQDFSHGETTTRYIIPNRTKSDDHDFEHDETTTQFTRKFSKIIQNINHNETTIQPIVKPTRVRHKPSRPIHEYDTTTQMKWRSDFIKQKQDVLETSTTPKANIDIITLKNHDFSQSKLNLSPYEREDQMNEEMFSTDRVDRAKQFSMPDNFANWKPEPKIANAVTKNKYFDYQQTVINPNGTITYDQDFSHGETTTRYIIPNRTKSDDHDFEHDETTTHFTRTFSKIIQNINHNETTIQPIVKPTRVRHKPSRPIHNYDTTTQMKWRRDFITQKQDVLENSTIPKPNIEIIKLKKHDFLHSKLNLSPYEREDQMNEEMLSTDRVVGRKRTETVSIDAKQFSMPDNFANWKPEPNIANAVPKNKYFDYQQTVINPNRTITYDQDFSHGETTTRYIIPNRTKSDDHDFEHDETTTHFTRTFSKIIQNINHKETTIQPIVKPTRVRHKPSRPIHEYDTTTQMKWRSDFTKKKQDVLENSTIGNINTLKNHDFLRSKLNLPSYEREDQMIEEMFSTDRVVGRKRTKTVSVDAKQFSMPDNFANWKPEPKIANFVTKNKNYHSVSPENRRKLTSPIVVPTRTPIADNIVTVADRQTTTIHPKTIEPVMEITETRNLIIPTRTRTKKIFKKKHHYALPRINIVTITPIKIPNRTKTLEYYIIPNVTATSSMYPKTAFSKDIAKSSQTNLMIPTRIRTKSVAKKFSQFLPSTTKTRKETVTTQHYTVPNRTKPMDDQHFSEDESTSQLTGTFSKVINKKSHLLTSRKPTKARTSLQYAIIPNRTEPILVDYSNGRATKHTRTFNFSRIPKKSHLLTSVSRTKVRTSLQYAMVPNRTDPIIHDLNYNSEGSAMAEYTTGNLSEVTKKSLHQTSRSSNKAKSKISLTLFLPTITRTAKQHYSNNGEPTLHATKFSRIAKKLHRLTSRLPPKGKVSRKSSLQNKIFPPRTLTILDQHYITGKITTSTRKTSKMSKYTHGPFISTKQTITGKKRQYENLPNITRTKEISSTDYKSRYLSTRLYDFVTEATLLPKRKPYKTSHVMQYETIQTKSTIEEPPTYITLTLTEDYKTREDVTTTEAFTEISEEYFNITYTIPTRTIGVIDQYTFILKPTKMSIVPQRTTGNLNNIKRNFGSKSKVRPNKNGLMKSKSHTNLDYNKTPGTIRTQNHFTKKFGLTRTSYQQALTRDRHKYKIGLTRPSEGQEIGPTRSTINAEYHYPTRTIDPQEYYTKTFGPTRLEPIRWTKKLYNGPTRTHMPEEESILHKIFKTTRTYYHADTKKLNDYLGYYTNTPGRKYKPDKHTFHDIPSKRSSFWTNMLAEYKTNDDSHNYRRRTKFNQHEEKTEQELKPNLDKEEDSDSGEKNPNLDKYENSDTGVQNPHLDKEDNSNRGEQNPNLDKGDNSDDTDTGETPNLNKEEQKSISPPIEQEEYKATAVQPDERANKLRLTRTTYKFKIVPTRTRQQHFRIMEGGHRPLNKNIQLNLDSSEERAFLFDNRNSILANSDKNEKKLKEIPVSFGKTRVMDDLESIEDVKFEFENVTEAPADYEIGRVTQIVSEATEEPDSYESLMKRINVLTPYPDAPALQSTKLGGFDDEETPRNSPKPKFKIKLKLDQTNKDKANEKEEIPDDVFPKYEELQAGPDEPPPQTEPAVPQPTEPQTTESDTETTEESSTESNETSTEPVPSDPCEVADNFLKKDLQNKTILPVPFTRTGVAIGTKLLTFALVVLVLRQAT